MFHSRFCLMKTHCVSGALLDFVYLLGNIVPVSNFKVSSFRLVNKNQSLFWDQSYTDFKTIIANSHMNRYHCNLDEYHKSCCWKYTKFRSLESLDGFCSTLRFLEYSFNKESLSDGWSCIILTVECSLQFSYA